MNNIDIEKANQGYLQATREVLELFEGARGPLVIDREDDDFFRVCYPLTTYSLNQARAAVLLHDEGMPHPATANVRVAFEHALWAEWVRLTDGAPEQVLSVWRTNNTKAARDLGAWTDLPPDLRDMVNEPPEGGVRPSFQAVCDRFGAKKKMIYTMYRSLNTAVHPSLDTLRRHLFLDPEGRIAGLSGDATAQGTSVEFYWVLGWSAVLAAFVQETLQHDHGRVGQIREIAQRFGLPLDLATEDNSSERQPTRQRAAGA